VSSGANFISCRGGAKLSDDYGSSYVGSCIEFHCHMFWSCAAELVMIEVIIFARCHPCQVLYVYFYYIVLSKVLCIIR